MNSRLDELQAAILRVKLKHLDSWNRKRSEIAGLYLDRLQARNKELVLPHVEDGNHPVWHLFTIRSNRRDELRTFLENRGIGTMIHYPVPLYKQEAYVEFNHLKDNYPISTAISEHTLSLPMGPHLSTEATLYVCKEINRFFKT